MHEAYGPIAHLPCDDEHMSDAGWFRDPIEPDLARWYDGEGWTEHTVVIADQPPGGAPPPPEIEPPPPSPAPPPPPLLPPRPSAPAPRPRPVLRYRMDDED